MCDLGDLGEIISSLTDHSTDPARPFTGQPHTSQGERGKTEVKGIRFRDLQDCAVKAFVDAAVLDQEKGWAEELGQRAEDGTLNYNDLFEMDLSQMDPVAFIQNLSCRVEKAMGIHPNVPTLHTDADETEEGIGNV